MEKPIRVLHVVTVMDRGGLETLLMNYYRNIDRNIIQFDFLTHRQYEQEYEKEIIELGGKVYKLSHLNPFSIHYFRELNHFFKEHNEYKIVHSHLDCLSSIPLKYAKNHNVSTRIAHSHSSSQEKNWKYIIKLFYKKLIPYYATDFFSCGQKAGRWMFDGADFFQLNNAINTTEFKYDLQVRMKYRNKFRIKSDEIIIGNVASFKDAKNHLFLLDVFFEIYKSNKNYKLFLVGDGILREKIEKKINKLNLQNNVILLGVRADVSQILQMFDLFLLPSLYEGFPVSILEAQCSGLTCIISDTVSNECNITGLVHQISLQCNAQEWCKKILELNISKRENKSQEIIQKKFDIMQNCKLLSDFYLSKNKESGK